MSDITVRATKGQVEDLKQSILWDDIVEELETWKEGFVQEMCSIVDDAAENNPSTAAVLLHMGEINGRNKAVDYMIGILDVFLSILEEKKDDTRRESTD